MPKQLSKEYREYIGSSRWRKGWRRGLTMRLLFGLDCIIPLLKAHHAEHLTYRNLQHELPIRDLVPLNRFMHISIVTPVKDFLRKILGQQAGNFVVAWFLRCCLLFWWAMVAIGVSEVYRLM